MTLPELNQYRMELYVATAKFPHRPQYNDCQKVLGLLNRNGLPKQNRDGSGIKIIPLDDLDRHRTIFYIRREEVDRERILPYLECIHIGTGIFSNHTGLEDVLEWLDYLGIHQKNHD